MLPLSALVQWRPGTVGPWRCCSESTGRGGGGTARLSVADSEAASAAATVTAYAIRKSFQRLFCAAICSWLSRWNLLPVCRPLLSGAARPTNSICLRGLSENGKIVCRSRILDSPLQLASKL